MKSLIVSHTCVAPMERKLVLGISAFPATVERNESKKINRKIFTNWTKDSHERDFPYSFELWCDIQKKKNEVNTFFYTTYNPYNVLSKSGKSSISWMNILPILLGNILSWELYLGKKPILAWLLNSVPLSFGLIWKEKKNRYSF